MEQLTEDQQRYLYERGFEIVNGTPSSDETYPFITLREPQRFFEQSEITYHQDTWARTISAGVCHPSNRSTDWLVQKIEEIAGGNMGLDGKVFETRPNQPIKVFVIDPAWKEVVEILANKYAARKGEQK